MENDIIGSIEADLKAGNITQEDAYKLRRYTQKPWEYLKANTKCELEEEFEHIKQICHIAERFAPEYDEKKIYAELYVEHAG